MADGTQHPKIVIRSAWSHPTTAKMPAKATTANAVRSRTNRRVLNRVFNPPFSLGLPRLAFGQ